MSAFEDLMAEREKIEALCDTLEQCKMGKCDGCKNFDRMQEIDDEISVIETQDVCRRGI